jgi:hypothetical protein
MAKDPVCGMHVLHAAVTLGARRVGVFVLVRKGGNEDTRDEFVSCLGD